MVFSSLFFVYIFFPICMFLLMMLKSINQKNIVLLIFSLLFYTWGEPKYIFILLFMTFSDWIIALLIEKLKKPSYKKNALILACIINLGTIALFKYLDFILKNINFLPFVSIPLPGLVLPIGISFYTFQLLSYVVDVYRKEVPAQKKFHIVLLYASLFHQCVAGPIVRYHDIESELLNRHVFGKEICNGITRFSVGLAKKSILANTCGQLANSFMISDNLLASNDAITIISSKCTVSLWLGVFMYALQIYLDFSAYSDMAIGMGWMAGFHYKENFNYPYMSRTVTEFWRRWHISLGTFFRDYVYIPLGGNRKGKKRTFINLFIVWLLTGLWHGASWNYIFWGLYFFIFLYFEKKGICAALNKKPKIISRLYLWLVVYFGWLIFKFENEKLGFRVFLGMFGLNKNSFIDFETITIIKNNFIFIIISIIAVTPICTQINQKFQVHSSKNHYIKIGFSVLQIATPIILLLLSTMMLVGNSYNPFLYFQF